MDLQIELHELINAEKDAESAFWFDNVEHVVQPCSSQLARSVVSPEKTHWIEIVLFKEQHNPVAHEEYEIRLPDGSTKTGILDSRGRARIEGIDAGMCTVTFPKRDGQSWNRDLAKQL